MESGNRGVKLNAREGRDEACQENDKKRRDAGNRKVTMKKKKEERNHSKGNQRKRIGE